MTVAGATELTPLAAGLGVAVAVTFFIVDARLLHLSSRLQPKTNPQSQIATSSAFALCAGAIVTCAAAGRGRLVVFVIVAAVLLTASLYLADSWSDD